MVLFLTFLNEFETQDHKKHVLTIGQEQYEMQITDSILDSVLE